MKLKKLPLYKSFFTKYDVIMVYLGGSQLLNLSTPSSDYDINIMIKENPTEKGIHKLMYNLKLTIDGIKIHFFINDKFYYLQTLKKTKLDMYEINSSLIKLYYFSEDYVIYKSKEANLIINNIKNNNLNLLKLGVYRFDISYVTADTITNFLSANKISKQIYAYIIGSYIVMNKKITKEKLDILLKFKRNFSCEFFKQNLDFKNILYGLITECHLYLKDHPTNVIALENKIMSTFK